MQLPDEIQDLCTAFLAGLKDALSDKLYGVYLYGALAFADGGPITDVDFHVILNSALDDGEKAVLHRLHGTLAKEHPPLGAELDGYYILLEDTLRTTPPLHQLGAGIVDNSWALHRAHIRAGRCIILYGPDPLAILPEPTWPELVKALESELAFVERALATYPAFCVLNLCRLMYSFETRDVVVSKFASAGWACVAYPAWRQLIQAAQHGYAGSATAEEKSSVELGVSSFLDFAHKRIAESRVSG